MVDSLEDEGMIILDKTCFYAESGGQVADKGTFSADGVEVEVLDVQKRVINNISTQLKSIVVY